MTRPLAPRLYGLMAEFRSPQELVDAAARARAEGYRRLDAYSPFPIEPLSEALGHRKSRVPALVLAGGILGGAGGYLLQYWVSVIAYPIDVGGRPLHSWPAFIPVTFEATILVAGLCAVLGMLALNGLPMPYHPVFNVGRFALASRDRYFLCIEARDPKFDTAATRRFLEGLKAIEVTDVAP
jgi:ActD protein